MSGPVFHSYSLSTDQPLGKGDRNTITLVANSDSFMDEAVVRVPLKGDHDARVTIFKADLDGDGELDFGARIKDPKLRLSTVAPGVFELERIA